MKKVFYILLAASAALFVSCAKDKDIKPTEEPVISEAPIFTGETITFEVNMDVQKETMASLSGLNINWQSGDYIGVATDNSATIVAYAVTPDGENPKKGTVTVNAVAEATKYYAIFRGSLGASGDAEKEVAANDFSGITFNTSTKTFSGLTVGKQQVAEGSLGSHLWYTNGFPLAMAGVGSANPSGNTLIMRPCLALFKVRIASASVPAGYYLNTETYTSSEGIDHDHTYSAVRGFNFYQIGSSTIYSSGDFTVSVADDGTLTTESVDNANRGTYRQISQEKKLTADTDYLMCLIPSGVQTTFKIDFLGYSNNSGGLSWDAVYSMSNPAKYTVSPGDFYDLGTLNPLGLKKAANEAADDAADEAAAAYVPAITVDGDLSDWDGISAAFSNSSNSRIREWRFKSDAQKIYFYFKIRKNRACITLNAQDEISDGKLYIGFNTDNASTGSTYGNIAGCESYVKVIPFTNVGEATTPDPVDGLDANSEVYASGFGSHNGTAYVKAYDAGESIGSSSSNIYLELSIPREYLNLPAAGNTITVGCSYSWYTTDSVSVTLE